MTEEEKREIKKMAMRFYEKWMNADCLASEGFNPVTIARHCTVLSIAFFCGYKKAIKSGEDDEM